MSFCAPRVSARPMASTTRSRGRCVPPACGRPRPKSTPTKSSTIDDEQPVDGEKSTRNARAGRSLASDADAGRSPRSRRRARRSRCPDAYVHVGDRTDDDATGRALIFAWHARRCDGVDDGVRKMASSAVSSSLQQELLGPSRTRCGTYRRSRCGTRSVPRPTSSQRSPREPLRGLDREALVAVLHEHDLRHGAP